MRSLNDALHSLTPCTHLVADLDLLLQLGADLEHLSDQVSSQDKPILGYEQPEIDLPLREWGEADSEGLYE